MSTEQKNLTTEHIDELSTSDMLALINREDETIASSIRGALPAISQAVDAIVEAIQNGGRLIYVGAGTSGRLGVLDASEMLPTFGVGPEVVQAIIAGGNRAITHSVEGAEDDEQAGRDDILAIQLSDKDVVIGIAASGRTPYTLGAIATANEMGAVSVGISCNRPAPLLDAASIKIAAVVGPEVISGSTRLKAGTAQKMILNMISTASMIKLGKVYSNMMVDVQVSNAKLAYRASRIVSQIAGVSEVEASELLRRTQNDVKTAIVIGKLNTTLDEAERLLKQARGRLRDVIG